MTDAEIITDLAAKLDACTAARMRYAERYAERVDELTALLARVAELESKVRVILVLLKSMPSDGGGWSRLPSGVVAQTIEELTSALAPKGATE